MKNYYVVIMAGGIGSRFWPFSTQEFPKQFHDMLGCGRTLLQKTFDRFAQFVPTDQILVLTNKDYSKLVQEQLPLINPNQILLEPVMRNTAPCVLYASQKVSHINPEALCVVAPSDHWIEDELSFKLQMQLCLNFCEHNDALLTLGVVPTFPNTGYGYIEYDKNNTQPLKKVSQFREKPDYSTAKSYIDKGNFLWNSGIFIWSVKSILKAFKNYQSSMYQLFEAGQPFWNSNKEQPFIDDNFHKSDNISIDYAILEQAQNVYVLPVSFDWNDLGTWGSLYDKLEKDKHQNAIQNVDVALDNCKGNILKTQNIKRIIAKDLNDYIIVEANQNLLLLPKKDEQHLKNLLNQ